MATLADVLQERGQGNILGVSNTAPIETPAIQELKASLAKQSPLNAWQSFKIGAENATAQRADLEKTYGKENVKPEDPTGEINGRWLIKDQDTGVWQPSAATSLGGKIAQALPSVPQTIVGLPQAASEGIAAATGGATLPELAASTATSGVLTGAADVGRQELGNLLAGQSAKNIDWGSVGTNTAAGALAPVVGKGVGMVAGKIGEKLAGTEASKAVDTTIADIAGKDADKAIITPSGKTMSLQDAIKGGLKGKTLQDLTDPTINEGVGAGTKDSVEEYTQAAADSIRDAKESVPKIESKIYQDAGISDTKDWVPVGDALQNSYEKIDKFAQTAVTDDDIKLMETAKNTLAKIESQSVDGEINFGQAKSWTNKLYDLRDAYLNPDTGRATPLSQMFKGIADEMTNAKNSLLKVKGAAAKVTALRSAEDELNQIMRLKTSMGDNRLYTKVQNLYKNPDLVNKFEDVKAAFAQIPETAHIAENLKKVNVAMANDDIATAKAPAENLLSHVPLINKLGVTKANAETQALFLKRLANEGVMTKDKLAQRIPVGDMPVISGIAKNVRAKAALYGPHYVPPDLTQPDVSGISGLAKGVEGGKSLGQKLTEAVKNMPINASNAIPKQVAKQTIGAVNNKMPKPLQLAPQPENKGTQTPALDTVEGIKSLIPPKANIPNLNSKIAQLLKLDKERHGQQKTG